MTIPFSEVRPASIKLKVLPRYPASFEVGPGLAVAQSAGVVTHSIDFTNLVFDPLTPVTGLYIAAWNDEDKTFKLYTSAALIGPQGTPGPANASDYETKALAAAATIDGAVNYLRIAGYTAAGDGGGALYKKVVSLATDAFGFQSADGAWWQLSESIISVLMTGAKNDTSIDSTAGINAAIAAARHASPSFGLAYTGGTVFFPGGIYHVSSINATQTAGLKLMAAPSSVVLYANQQTLSSKPVIDMTGSSGCLVDGIIVGGSNSDGSDPSILPAAGFLVAQSTAGADCNKNRFSNCGTLGKFTNAALYMYGATDNIFDACGFQQNIVNAPCMFHSNSNDFSIASSYTTIETGALTTGENSFFACEFHGNRTSSGVSPTVSLKDAYAVRFYGGNNDANGTTTSHYYFQGTNNAITISGVQIYSEGASPTAYVFESNGATINGLIVTGCHALSNAFATSEFTGPGFTDPIVMASPGLTSLP